MAELVENEENLIVTEIDDIGEHKNADTYKIYYDQCGLKIDFGKWKNHNQVEVLSKIILSDKQIFSFIQNFLNTSINYQSEYNKKIFPDGIIKDESKMSSGKEE